MFPARTFADTRSRRGAVLLTLALAGCGRVGYDVASLGNRAGDGEAPGPVDAAPSVAVDAGAAGGPLPRDAPPPADGPGLDHTAVASDAALPRPDAVTPDAGCVGPTVDHCQQIPSLTRAPVIDGVLECGLGLQRLVPTGWNGGVTTMPPAENVAHFAVAHGADGVYVFITVDDPNYLPALADQETHCGDAVEIYLDDDGRYSQPGMYDEPGTRQIVITGPPSATESAARAFLWRQQVAIGPWTSTQFRAFGRPGGYIVEAFIRAPDLGLPRWNPTSRIGFNLSVDVSRTERTAGRCGDRLGQYYLRSLTPGCPASGGKEPFCSTESFCTPRLL